MLLTNNVHKRKHGNIIEVINLKIKLETRMVILLLTMVISPKPWRVAFALTSSAEGDNEQIQQFAA